MQHQETIAVVVLWACNPIQGGPKMAQFFWYALTSSNINRFQVCRYAIPCEMSSVLKATIENETTSVTTYFEKLTRNHVFIVSVIV